MNFLTTLQQLPDGVSETTALIAQLDQCFLSGFTNLDNTQEETLASLRRVFTGTPLAQPLSDSLAAILRNEFMSSHFMGLASTRAALQGAQFDHLQQQVRTALNRSAPSEAEIAQTKKAELPSHAQVWMESAQQWLMELALSGFARLNAGTLTPFMATLEQIQSEAQLVRPAALLTGFFNELIAAVPIADATDVPLYRWVDLWTRAMISTSQPASSTSSTLVSGHLSLLGIDVRQHANFVNLVIYGVLDHDTPQLVRIPFSSYKVDAVSEQQTWLLFPQIALLLEGLAKKKALQVQNMSLLPTGDLIWRGEAELAGKYDLLKTADQWFAAERNDTPTLPFTPPLNRHPIQLAEPLFLDGYTITEDNDRLFIKQDDTIFPIATERLGTLSEITPETLKKSSQLFGLLRYDAGKWAIQPLSIFALKKKRKPELISTGMSGHAILKKPPRNNTVSILKERASRLLRR